MSEGLVMLEQVDNINSNLDDALTNTESEGSN